VNAPAVAVGRLGAGVLGAFGVVGAWTRLGVQACGWAVVGPWRSRVIGPRLFTSQMARVGAQSAPLIFLVSALIGIILILQSATTLDEYGQLALAPRMVAMGLVRELGPLLTALILAGRVGAAFTAEIGTMVVSEEVQALETMGVPPVGYLVAPRLIACLTMVPCITLCADAVGILGGFVISVTQLGLGATTYFEETALGLRMQDLVLGEVKAVVFGWIIAVTACYRALRVRGAADEVGRATMQSVVSAMVLIIVANSIFATVVNAWS
jgi:phospholipid/cholesterol/gamma-HCH transport system permease protein